MLSSSSSSSSSSSINNEPVSKTTSFFWTVDLVWRSRSWKDVPIHFDSLAGKMYFCKPERPEVYFHIRKLAWPEGVV